MKLNRYFMAGALCAALIAPAGFATRALAQDPNYRQDDPNYRQDRVEDPDYRQDRDRDHDRDRDQQYGSAYSKQARERGYQDGLSHGQGDARGHHSFRPTDSDAFKNADAGYRSDFGDKNAYRDVYRKAYEEGYRQGYYGNSRHDHGDNDHDRDDRDRDH